MTINNMNFFKPKHKHPKNRNISLILGFLFFSVGITMATYLTISLGISLLMNWYNKRIAIQEK